MKKTLVFLVMLALGAAAVPLISLAGGAFYVDGSTGFVGIGNTTPAAPLDVAGAMYSRLVTASSTAIDWNQGNVQEMTLSSSPTLTFSNGQAGGEYKLILNQDSTGGRTIVWPSSIVWANGAAPTLSSSPDSTDALSFVYDGSRYLGDYSLNYGTASTTFALTDDLLAYWKLDESSGDASDSVGSNTLTNDGSATFSTTTGVINNGVSFDGSQDLSGSLVSSATTNITVALWVYIPSASEGGTFFHSGSDAGSGDGFSLGVGDQDFDHAGNHLLLLLDLVDWINPGVDIGTGWHYVAVTRDSSVWRLYIDGTQLSTTSTESPLTPTSTFQLGRESGNSGGRFFTGYEDEVGYWNRALSSSEISELYNGGAGLQYPF